MIKGLSAITKYKNGITKIKATDKLSVKSIILPDVHESDDSTINFTKRVGGEMIQCYSLSEVKLKQPDICVPTFKEVIFTPCRASSVWVDVPCESSLFDFEVDIPRDSDFSFTTRNRGMFSEYNYETGEYALPVPVTTPLGIKLELKDIEGPWNLKINNEIVYSSDNIMYLDRLDGVHFFDGYSWIAIIIPTDTLNSPVNSYKFSGSLGAMIINNYHTSEPIIEGTSVGSLEVDFYSSPKIKRFVFQLGPIELYLPPIPRHITSTESMFSYSDFISSDITSWDTSNIKNMSSMFYGCKNFNQDIGHWNTSNVINVNSMFRETDLFNRDISNWDTSKIKDMARMFCFNPNFNKNISNWNVSLVEDMTGMFEACEKFNQDLSKWCVTKIPTKPEWFNEGATLWTLPKPVWGTCPATIEDPETPETDLEGFVFSIQNISSSSNVPPFKLRVDKGVYPSDPWSLKDSSGNVIASNDGTFNENFMAEDIGGVVRITLPLYSTKETYQFIGKGFLGNLEYYSEVLPYPATLADLPDTPEIKVHVERFSETIESYQFYVDCVDFKVPNQLAPHIINCESMFKECYFFNQDISSWNVSNVTNMEGMFESALSFNRDLSNWCVDRISTKPNNFDSKAESWTLPKPVWGTCPEGIPTNPTESLISYLNIKLIPAETSNTKISYINIITSNNNQELPS